MSSDWIQPPPPPLLVSRADPYVTTSDREQEVLEYFSGLNVFTARLDLTSSASESAVVDGIRSILPFPDWCGSGWDSMEDAYEELREAWTFPLALVVNGLPTLMSKTPQLALQTVVRLSDFIRAFSTSADQLIVVYVVN